MKVLLDTHAILWFINGDHQLSVKARQIVENTENQILISAISLFEIAIKLKLNKLTLQKSMEEIFVDINTAGIETLPIREIQLLQYQVLPMHSEHRDPFDRLIIATAISEKAAIIGIDRHFNYYHSFVEVLW